MLRSHSRDLVIRGAGRGRPVGDVGVLSGGEEVRCPAGRGPERAALSHRSLCTGGPVARAARVCDWWLRLRPGERRAGHAAPARRRAQQVRAAVAWGPRTRGWEPVLTAAWVPSRYLLPPGAGLGACPHRSPTRLPPQPLGGVLPSAFRT